ncbi:uncharacterized protein FYW35_005930 isoform 2-T2 [Pterocles gutturalis]
MLRYSSSLNQHETFKFVLSKSIDGDGEVFEEVSESKLQPGDIVLWGFPTGVFNHAAVYCCEGEIIHFLSTNVPGNHGRILKEGLQALKKKRGKCQIYQKIGGIDLRDFKRRIREVMNSEAYYNLDENNCIHFALCLLGLGDFYMQLVKTQNAGDSCDGWVSHWQREFQALEFLLVHALVERGAFFQEVSESKLQPGDIALFPLLDRTDLVTYIVKHAAVYCGDGEVIHFQGMGNEWNSGRVSKEGFQALKKKRGNCQVYRKIGGINLRDLNSRVREVMNSEAYYDWEENNCIHFALSLLGLVDFYTQQVSTELSILATVIRLLHPQPALHFSLDPIPPGAGPWAVGRAVGTVVGTVVGTAKPCAHVHLSLAGEKPKMQVADATMSPWADLLKCHDCAAGHQLGRKSPR